MKPGGSTSSRNSQAAQLLEVAKAAERDSVVEPEPVDGDPQELRRAVHDHHADAPVADPLAQALEKDPGAARVVDEDVAVAQVAVELVDGQVEIAVPAVVLDRVVVQAERVDRLRDPVLLGDPLERAPVERHELIVVRERGAATLVPLYDPRRLP